MKNIIKKIIAVAFVFSLFFMGGQQALAYTPGYVSSNTTHITQNSAVLNGTFNPSGLSTNAFYQTPTNSQLGYQSIGSGFSNVAMNPYSLNNLTPNTTYTFRIIATNDTGTTYGPWISFTTKENIITPPAPTLNLTANPTSIPYNGTSIISWTTSNAMTCAGNGGSSGWQSSKNNNGGTFTANNLTTDTTFNLFCNGYNGSGVVMKSVTVYVSSMPPPPPPVPTVHLTANPNVVVAGGSTTLSWTSTNATACSANASPSNSGWTGSKNLNGSQTVSNINVSTTFTLVCQNSSGNASDAVLVYTTTPPPPTPAPTVNLVANPNSVAYGGGSTLSWNSTNATTCNASASPAKYQWSSTKNTSGSVSISNLNSTTYFNITCSGAGGTASDTVSVTVGNQPPPPPPPPPPPAPTVHLTANPNFVAYNGSTTLSWTVTNAIFCIASGGWGGGTTNTSGSYVVTNLTSSDSFTLTCTNASGSASDSATVTVAFQPPPPPPPPSAPTVNLTANPNSVAYNGSSTLSWNSTNATTCNATGGVNGWAGAKNTNSIFPTGTLINTTTYTIMCNGAGGSATDSVTVFVASQPNTNLPLVTTNAVNNVGTNYATLNGFVNANSGTNVSAWFEWGTNGNYGTMTTQNNYGSTTGINYSYVLGGLSANTSYYYRAVAQNASGQVVYGSQMSFTTTGGNTNTSLPNVTTYSATGLSETNATLNGFVEPNGSFTTRWFEWGTSYSNLFNSTTHLSQGTTAGNFNQSISGLSANTIYYFRAVASNSNGTAYGNVMSFTTLSAPIYNPCSTGNCAPTAITTLATNIGQTSARLNGLGLVNNNVLTTGYFEWGTTQFLGTITQSTAIGNSQSNPFFNSVFGLSPNTTYFYRAVVTNQYGTSRGDIATFRTNIVNPVINTGTNTKVITKTNVIYRDVVVNTNTTANLLAGVSKPSLVFLGVNCNNQVLVPGEIFECVVNWKNVSSKNLTDVLLRVGFPRELTFLQASRGYFSEVDNAVVVEIVNLAPGEEGSMMFTTRVRTDAQLGKVVVVAGSLVYSYTGDTGAFAQEEVFAYSNHTIQGGLQLQAGTVFTASYLPSSLLGWLLLLLIILLIILLARMAYNSTRPNTVIIPEQKNIV